MVGGGGGGDEKKKHFLSQFFEKNEMKNVVYASLLVHTNKLQELWFHAIEYGLQHAQAANTFS